MESPYTEEELHDREIIATAIAAVVVVGTLVGSTVVVIKAFKKNRATAKKK